ncbi:MAG: hypothetical protein K9N21_19295 [Deltaproteobacteria bacterium]|nr:hypothetical protein [Deltaproteobacteria bacterium]
MATATLLEQTQELLQHSVPGDQDIDAKVRELIKAEWLRQLARYRRVDMDLTRKYGLTFDKFLSRRITRKMDYAWEVEQDAMDWETAIGGMQTVERKLKEMLADQ